MACNCKAKAKVTYIEKKYGNGRSTISAREPFSAKAVVKALSIYAVTFMFFPVIIGRQIVSKRKVLDLTKVVKKNG